MQEPIGPRHDYAQQVDHAIMSEMRMSRCGCRDPCEYESLKGVGGSGRRIAQIAETVETRRTKKVLDDATQMVV